MKMKKLKIALLDLYNGEKTDAIFMIDNLLSREISKFSNINFQYDYFDVRAKDEIADLTYDIFISSGGPGSPFDGLNQKWETNYFKLLDDIYNHNQKNSRKKFLFGICYTFQLMGRFFEFGDVTKRNNLSFGAVKIQKTESGKYDAILTGLPNTFYGIDNRNWQVVNPNNSKLAAINGKILALEKLGSKSEKAMMAIRISNEIFAVQFHPEKNSVYLKKQLEKDYYKKLIINRYGIDAYDKMLKAADEPAGVDLTYNTIIPNFFKEAVNSLKEQ